MGTRTQIEYFDDLDQEAGEDIETHTFALDGTEYEIDLREKNALRLTEALQEFIDGARVTARPRRRRITTPAAPSNDLPLPQRVRAWAAENGIEVNPYGRVPKALVEQYEAAQ